MAPRSQYNLNTFRSLIKSGKTKSEIMGEMAIKNNATFSNLMLRLMNTDKKYYAVKESKEIAAKKVQKTTIGKNNTLTLSAKMIENTGFKAGNVFNIKAAKNKIILTLIEE